MIKNYNFNISEEEKRQILNLHESRTKRHYLINEQKTPFNDAIEKENVRKIQYKLGFKDQALDGKLGINTYNAIMAKLTGTPEKEEENKDLIKTPDEIEAEEKATAEKTAAEKLAAEKLAAEKEASEKLAAEKTAAEKLAAEKLATQDDGIFNPAAPD